MLEDDLRVAGAHEMEAAETGEFTVYTWTNSACNFAASLEWRTFRRVDADGNAAQVCEVGEAIREAHCLALATSAPEPSPRWPLTTTVNDDVSDEDQVAVDLAPRAFGGVAESARQDNDSVDLVEHSQGFIADLADDGDQ